MELFGCQYFGMMTSIREFKRGLFKVENVEITYFLADLCDKFICHFFFSRTHGFYILSVITEYI